MGQSPAGPGATGTSASSCAPALPISRASLGFILDRTWRALREFGLGLVWGFCSSYAAKFSSDSRKRYSAAAPPSLSPALPSGRLCRSRGSPCPASGSGLAARSHLPPASPPELRSHVHADTYFRTGKRLAGVYPRRPACFPCESFHTVSHPATSHQLCPKYENEACGFFSNPHFSPGTSVGLSSQADHRC